MRAVALYSGGLDSLLAMKIIKEQGIDVIALFFDIGFYANIEEKRAFLQRGVAQIGVELHIIDIREQFFKEVLFSPKYGYGKNLNPCIDCHANMIRYAKNAMSELEASFIISGEVLGQRPKSQRSQALREVNLLSGADGLILRPLCAKLMPPTIPEMSGWVDRERLLDISGRDRSRQIALAKEYGLSLFESPGGGCLLTDREFSLRLKDLVNSIDADVSDVEAIKNGRYFVLPDGARLIVARNESECDAIERFESSKFLKIFATELVGAIGLLDVCASECDIALAASIILTYSRSQIEREYIVSVGGMELLAKPLSNKSEALRYLL